jgi:hypothetical protein
MPYQIIRETLKTPWSKPGDLMCIEFIDEAGLNHQFPCIQTNRHFREFKEWLKANPNHGLDLTGVKNLD